MNTFAVYYRKYLDLNFRAKFFIASVFISFCLALIIESGDFIKYIKFSYALNNVVAECKKLPPWENIPEVDSKSGETAPKEIAVLCDEELLTEDNIPPLDLKNPDGTAISKTYKQEIVLQHKIVTFAQFRDWKADDIVKGFAGSLGLGLFVGVIPFLWNFFLKRLAEISSAIRGESTKK